jgi:hypothetical protein
MMQLVVLDIVSCSKSEGMCSVFIMDNLFILQYLYPCN